MYKRYITWLKTFSISMLLMTVSLLAHSNPNEGTNESGRVIYSVGSGGDWNSTTTWVGGVVPSTSDVAVIVDNARVNITHAVWVYQIKLNHSSKICIGNTSRDVNLTFDDISGAGFRQRKGMSNPQKYIYCNGTVDNPVNITRVSSHWDLFNRTDGTGLPVLNIYAKNATFWRYRWDHGDMDNSPDIFFDNCTLYCTYGGWGCIHITGEDYAQDTLPFFYNCTILSPVRIYASGIFEHCIIDIEEYVIAEVVDDIMIFYKCLFPSSKTISQLYGQYYPYDIVGGDGIVWFDYKNSETNSDGDYVCLGGGKNLFYPQSHPDQTELCLSRIPTKYLPRSTDRILITGSANPYPFATCIDVDYTFYKITMNGRAKCPPHIFIGNVSQKLNFAFKDLEGGGIFTTTHLNNIGQFINISNCSFSKEINTNYAIFNLENALDPVIRNVTINSIGEVQIGQPDKGSDGKVLYGSRITLENVRMNNSTYGLIFGYKIGNNTILSLSNIIIENSQKYGSYIKTKSRKITIENISIKNSGIADIKIGKNSVLELRNSTFSTIDKTNTNWTVFSLNNDRTDTNITWLSKTPINDKITFNCNYTGQYNVLKPVDWEEWCVYDDTDGINLTKKSRLLDGFIQFNATAIKVYTVQKADGETNQSHQTNPYLYNWLLTIREEWRFRKWRYRRYFPI